ncbi:MFS transporter [Roseococcus sp.]|uniref:MFS transporter n=1 Tax=Roseococcus sp. TaxID=2109646 RepID=UPI003BAA7F57
MSPPRSFALIYGAQFLGIGAMTPFLPAILAEGGLTAGQVGGVMAAGSVMKLMAAPAGGRIADGAGDVRVILAIAAVVAAAAAMGFGLVAGLALLLAVQVVHAIAVAPVVPLTDALAVGAVRNHGFDYARVRASGSITYIIGAVLAGQAVALGGPRMAAWILAAALIATAGLALRLPDGRRPGAKAKGSLWAPLREPGFVRILVITALIQGSHALYYAFSTIHWQRAGLGTGLIGALWGFAVVSEVLLFLYGRGFVLRLGVRGLVMLAAAAGVLRWCVFAVTTEPTVLLPVQILHGATFGAMHLATMQALLGLPATVGARAQTLVASAVSATSGALMWGSGLLYAATGGHAFFAMAGLCALGFALGLGIRKAG